MKGGYRQMMSITVAYIDPGTASQIVAIVSGIVITAAVTLGIMRTKISMFFQKKKIDRLEKKILKENPGNVESNKHE
jgi:hypothetical protein